jgi:hypothetical protein
VLFFPLCDSPHHFLLMYHLALKKWREFHFTKLQNSSETQNTLHEFSYFAWIPVFCFQIKIKTQMEKKIFIFLVILNFDLSSKILIIKFPSSNLNHIVRKKMYFSGQRNKNYERHFEIGRLGVFSSLVQSSDSQTNVSSRKFTVSFSNCQNFLFQTVKICFLKLSKFWFSLVPNLPKFRQILKLRTDRQTKFKTQLQIWKCVKIWNKANATGVIFKKNKIAYISIFKTQ